VLVVTEVVRSLLYQLSFQQFSSMGPAALFEVVEPLAKQVKKKNNKEAQREQGQASASGACCVSCILQTHLPVTTQYRGKHQHRLKASQVLMPDLLQGEL
jgi:hypothetical protein